ncbi:MAG: Asp-tRNA(Asn)/Glu-tRNA(Gln) amidotransferase subunit GatB [Candidatus Omnitrophota bacterium]
MNEFEAVIGLEVHLQLATQTKLFCGCLVKFASEPNRLTCPVCLGLPGSLPVINEKAISYALKVALALNCTIGEIVKFDRKNYYYPDLPKNYQISQYDLPLASRGSLLISGDNSKKIRIRRVHLEEDAGKLIHEEDCSLVDYNRTGVPLLEIVTEPEINSSEEAYNYLLSLKTLLKYLEVSDCDMEKGSLRCDANISMRVKDSSVLGTKTELKNMNSFKAVRCALDFEIKRQSALLEKGGAVVQETRLWDEEKGITISMRSKEEASDYRYFPEPDLVPFSIDRQTIETVKSSLPELPQEKALRLRQRYKLSEADAQFLVIEPKLVQFFEDCCKVYQKPKIILNWIKGPLSYEINQRNKPLEELKLKIDDFLALIKLVDNNTLSNLSAKSVLTIMLEEFKSPKEIIKEKNLDQVSNESSLLKFIEEVLAENQATREAYLNGKTNSIMFLVGQVMKNSKGKANPKIVKEILEKKLKGEKNA